MFRGQLQSVSWRTRTWFSRERQKHLDAGVLVCDEYIRRGPDLRSENLDERYWYADAPDGVDREHECRPRDGTEP